MSEPSKMPARILCDSIDAALCKPGNRINSTTRHLTAYVRADIADQMAAALRKIEYASRKDSLSDHERLQSVRATVCAALSAILKSRQAINAGHAAESNHDQS